MARKRHTDNDGDDDDTDDTRTKKARSAPRGEPEIVPARSPTLYDDVLGTLMGFLHLRERGIVAGVSHAWNRCALLSASFDTTIVRCMKFAHFAGLIGSPVARRHLHGLSLNTVNDDGFKSFAMNMPPAWQFTRLRTFIFWSIHLYSWVIPLLRACPQIEHIHANGGATKNTPFVRALLADDRPWPTVRDVGPISLADYPSSDWDALDVWVAHIVRCLPGLHNLRLLLSTHLIMNRALRGFRDLNIEMLELEGQGNVVFQPPPLDCSALNMEHLVLVRLEHVNLDKKTIECLANAHNLREIVVWYRGVSPDFTTFAHPHIKHITFTEKGTLLDVPSRALIPLQENVPEAAIISFVS